VVLVLLQKQANEEQIEELELLHAEVRWRDDDLQHKEATIERQAKEYRDLMEIKIKLDADLRNYQKMVETDEAR